MAIVISGNGIDMGGNPVSNASQIDGTVINENGSNVISQGELAYDVDTSSFIANTLSSGAIIERGSNANGEYIKYADGTLICRQSATGAIVVEATLTDGYIWTFPHSFANYIVNLLLPVGASSVSLGAFATIPAISSFSATIKGWSSSSVRASIYTRPVAIGRWK